GIRFKLLTFSSSLCNEHAALTTESSEPTCTLYRSFYLDPVQTISFVLCFAIEWSSILPSQRGWRRWNVCFRGSFDKPVETEVQERLIVHPLETVENQDHGANCETHQRGAP
ncbi:hypothetical protein Tcan_00494, partial [Toxocara canis]